jgi:isochorismate synthase
MTTHSLNSVRSKADEALEPARFLFRCGSRSLQASGIAAVIDTPARDGAMVDGHFHTAIADAFSQARRAGVAKPLIIGAIPFDTHQASCLYVPQEHAWVEHQAPAGLLEMPAARVVSQHSVPDQAGFQAGVSEAIAQFRLGRLSKAVLSRRLDVELGERVDVAAVMARLEAQNPEGYHFRVPMPDGAELIGVSPELLVRKQHGQLFSNPLAGSAKRHGDLARDQQIALALLDSAKDHYEHRLVVEDIRRLLHVDCLQLQVAPQPSLLGTAAMWHLSTLIEGQLRDPRQSVLQLACRLHPTPAVCGAPTEVARALIERVEPFERGLFTGMVGWCDAEGNGEWVVTIRCATVRDRHLSLYAGAGIVEASDPAAEWAETQAKLGTMLKAFGLDRQERP